MSLHYHIGELYHPWFKNLTAEQEDEDDDKEEEERARKSRIMGYKNRSISATTDAEKVAISLGIFFVAAVSCYAVYLGINHEATSEEGTGFLSTNVVFDAPVVNDMYDELHLPDELQPLKYILYLNPSIDKMEFRGLVKIKVKCVTNTSRIILHSARHTITKVTMKTTNVTDIEDITVKHSAKNVARDTVIFTTNQRLVEGYHYDFYLGFRGNISASYKNGIYVTETTKEKILSTMFYPASARKVFPCFDEPQYKAPFELILQHPKNLRAISNMDTKDIVSLADSKRVETHFHPTDAISTHQLSFVVSNLKSKEKLSKNGNKVRLFSCEDQIKHVDYALELASSFVDFYEQKLNFNYTNTKLDLVMLPSMPFHYVSSYGIIQAEPAILIYNKEKSTIFEQQNMIVGLAQMVAYQWFGNIISLNWWNEAYIAYGFSRLLARSLLSEIYKDWNFASIYNIQMLEQSLRTDASQYAKALADNVKEPSEKLMFTDSNSVKSETVIAMVSQRVGENKFYTLLSTLLKEKKFSTMTLKDLGDFFATYARNVDVVDFLHYWTTQSGFPYVTATIAITNTQLSVVQNKFSYVKQTDWTLWRFELPTHYSCNETTSNVAVESHNELVGIPEPCLKSSDYWYKSNVDGQGFFRVDYDKTNWKHLFTAMSSGDKFLSALDRSNLLSDLFEMAKFHYRSIGDALALTLYLHKETSYAPIKTALLQLDYTTEMIEDVKLKTCLKIYKEDKVTAIFKNLQNKTIKTVEDKYLFNLLINIVTDKESELSADYIREYDILFLEWVLSSESNNIPNYLRDIIFKVGLKYGQKYELKDIVDYYFKSTSFSEKNLILKTLGYNNQQDTLLGKEQLSMQETLKLLSYSCQHGSARKAALGILKNRWSDLSSVIDRNPELVSDFFWQCFGNIKSDYKLNELTNALKERTIGEMQMVYDRTIEQIQHNIKFIASQSGELEKFFMKYYPQCLKS